MILTNEDYDGLRQIQFILSRIIKNAVMSELEENREQNFERLTTQIKRNGAFEAILSKRRNQMPQKFRAIFTEQWFVAHTRLKPNGVYEIRCNIDKVPISGSSKDLDTAMRNFIAALSKAEGKAKSKEKVKRILFLDFAEKWFKVVKKPTVKPITYESFLSVYRAHILPYFNGKFVDELTAMKIQPLFAKLYKIGRTKAAINVSLLLNQIFKAAIAERLITFNPMDGVTILKHHAKNGTALTYDEEAEFLRKLEVSKYKLTYTLMLYCGMRRAELSSARIEGSFVIVKNGKQRLSEIKTERKIPITPMLSRYLKGISKKDFKEAIGYKCDLLSRAFKDLCPAHHLHELRHTFITRCQECGVPREVVSVWAGHSSDNTMTSNVYTHFSEEFMLSEAQKVDYYNRFSE